MELSLLYITLVLISFLTQTCDNNNLPEETKKLAIVQCYKALTQQEKNKLTAAEKKTRKAWKSDLINLAKQDYAAEFHDQINSALKQDKFKTPETSPVKLYPAILKKQPVQTATDFANKENVSVRFNRIVNCVNFGYQQTAPDTVKMDMIFSTKIPLKKTPSKKQKNQI
jgi:hypothetical protein